MAPPLTEIETQMRAMLEAMKAAQAARAALLAGVDANSARADVERAEAAAKKAAPRAVRAQVMAMAKLERLLKDKPAELGGFAMESFDATRRALEADFTAFMEEYSEPLSSTAVKVFKHLREMTKDVALELFGRLDAMLAEATSKLAQAEEENEHLSKRLKQMEEPDLGLGGLD